MNTRQKRALAIFAAFQLAKPFIIRSIFKAAYVNRTPVGQEYLKKHRKMMADPANVAAMETIDKFLADHKN